MENGNGKRKWKTEMENGNKINKNRIKSLCVFASIVLFYF